MGKKYLIFVLVILIISSLTPLGCMQTNTSDPRSTSFNGTITVSGAWALYPLMIRWSEEFQVLHPDVIFDISAGGAGKGMADTLSGAVDIGMVSREIYSEEIDKGAFWVSVTKDAVFPTINEDNPVLEELFQSGITQDELIGIFVTGEITTWGQLVDQDERSDPIHVYTRSDACGAAATWASYLNKSQEDLLGIGIYGDPGLLDAVIRDPLGIGYNNLNYAFDMETGLPPIGVLVLPIDINSNGKTEPDEIFSSKEKAVKAVASGFYPSPPARYLNLVTKGKPTGLAKIFITWVLTDGQDYVDQVGYVGLSIDKLDEELSKLE